MPTLHAARARLPEGWATDVRIEVEGTSIARVTPGARPAPDDRRVGVLLPALSNLHSHAFQRATAGRTERRAAGRDSFWTWREEMYRFVERLTPDTMRAIAALAFCEMQEAGFAAVGEFHYVHNGPDGQPYDDPAELSRAIFEAAGETGIGLTHLPVLYRFGGAGLRPLSGGQRRFGTTPDDFALLLDACRTAARNLPDDTGLGLAPHSLRAISPEDLAWLLPLAEGGPVHIHVAEQPREVEEVSAWLGARPVEWLLANAPVDVRWCAVHATHMTPTETAGLAATGAVAGLCPITEANLGDGAFDGPGWLASGGAFGVGSDSNVRISAAEELRMLEYAQRLRDLSRNVMAPENAHVGAHLYLAAARGGAQALGRNAGTIREGALADLVALDPEHPALACLDGDALLDGFVFAAGDGAVTDLWSAGRHAVQGGRHIARDAIRAAYAKALKSLVSA